MRIGLTFNLKPAGATGDRFEEFDSEETIVALERALRAHGHDPVRLGWGMEMLDARMSMFGMLPVLTPCESKVALQACVVTPLVAG